MNRLQSCQLYIEDFTAMTWTCHGCGASESDPDCGVRELADERRTGANETPVNAAGTPPPMDVAASVGES